MPGVLPVLMILGILQCGWAREPDRVEAMLARAKRESETEACYYQFRRSFIRRFIAIGNGVTWKRLEAAGFGEIEFEEASPRIGWEASANFGYDRDHLVAAIRHANPTIIIAFGKVAQQGLDSIGVLGPKGTRYFKTCHPAARRKAAEQLKRTAGEVFG